jgi:hypothetical protein
MILKRVGFFRELRHGLPSGPSLREAVRASRTTAEIPRIVSYLESGALFIACPGLVRDALEECGQVIGSPHVRTDGVWAWPSDLPYYVRRYRVELPKEFVKHMEENGWQPPSFDRAQLADFRLED